MNAYYNPQLNEMVFPAGILQPPFYTQGANDAVNYGAIGFVVGHELTHGFDDEGRQFDAKGNLTDWWSKPVCEEFERRAECVVKQYDGYPLIDDVKLNGKLTLGENIADLGGLKLAFAAYQASRAGRPHEAPVGGFSADQQFFLAARPGLVHADPAGERPAPRRHRSALQRPVARQRPALQPPAVRGRLPVPRRLCPWSGPSAATSGSAGQGRRVGATGQRLVAVAALARSRRAPRAGSSQAGGVASAPGSTTASASRRSVNSSKRQPGQGGHPVAAAREPPPLGERPPGLEVGAVHRVELDRAARRRARPEPPLAPGRADPPHVLALAREPAQRRPPPPLRPWPPPAAR